MHRASRLVMLAAMLGLSWATAAFAQEGALDLLPDDEILEAGEMSLEYEEEGPVLFRGDAEHTLTLRAGLGSGAEIGVASGFAGSGTTVGLFEVNLVPQRPGRPAIMIGAQTLGAGRTSLPYLLISERRPRLDAFAGVARGEHRTLPFWSVSLALTDDLGLFAQGVRGERWATGLGLSVELSPQLELEVARQFGETDVERERPARDQWFLDVTYTWGLREEPAEPASPPPPATEDSDTARSAAPRTPGR